MNRPDHSDYTDIRQLILDAAEQRFRQYGYTKTTMAEIAADVHMSAANLYRYFDNKQDIAAACAGRCLSERTALLNDVVHKSYPSAAARLEAFVITMLRYTHERTAADSKINQLVETIATERRDIVHQKDEAECALLARILEQGHAGGEFQIDDALATARTVHSALTLFEVPIFMALHPLDEFETMARELVRLLVTGLRGRR